MTEREKFEEWVNKFGYNTAKDSDGEYLDFSVTRMFTVWQAALSEPSQAEPVVWIPVSERLPEAEARYGNRYSRSVLTLYDDGENRFVREDRYDHEYNCWEEMHTPCVTMWMEMPAAPQEQK